MKKLFIILSSILMGLQLLAQSPEAFNYQAVIKDAQGAAVSNQIISLQISILQGGTAGTSVYVETHQAETNAYGLVSIKIGEGDIVSGNFSSISWGSDLYFVRVEADIAGGSDYSEIGTMQLSSVPYALYANDVLNKDDADADPTNEIQTLSVTSDQLTISDGNTVTLPAGNPTDELQTLSIADDQLSISDGNTVTIPDADNSNELQTLGLNGAIISITDGNSITLPDADNTNELQTLGLNSNTLSISNGNSVNLSNYESPWLSQGNNIYYNNGNVGIGKNTPQARLEVKASASSSIDDPLLQVINKTGDTVFAVYDGGVIINFDESAKGNIGGFAVSGRTTSKGTRDYFTVSKDSTRVYVDQGVKGNIGGFAVSGRTTSKGNVNAFLNLTPENYLIGHRAGDSITTGHKNFYAGYEAGMGNKEGFYNVAIGYKAGRLNNSASNVFIGTEAGTNNVSGWSNVFIGNMAGFTNYGGGGTLGARNIFIGREAGHANYDGGDNIYMGTFAGSDITSGDDNVIIGTTAASYNTTSQKNVYIGNRAAYSNNGGNNVVIGNVAGSNGEDYSTNSNYTNSVMVGDGAGYNNITGAGNIFLGYRAGYNEAGSNKLYIHSSSTSTPLIYGDFTSASEFLRINGDLRVNNNNFQIEDTPGAGATPAYYAYQGGAGSSSKSVAFAIHDALWVSSNAWVDGTFYNTKGSYQLAKPSLQNTLAKVENIDISKVLKLQAEYFVWDESKFPVKDSLPATKQIGLNPEQVGKLFPELVKTDERGDKYINYSKLSIILLEALKEQNKEVEVLRESDMELKKRLDAIEKRLNDL